MKGKIRAPFDVNVSRIVCAVSRYVSRYQHELFLHQQVDLQTRSMLGCVHDRNVNESGRHMGDQILRDVDMNTKRYIRMRASHHPDPFEQKRLPQAYLAPYSQNRAMTLGHGHLLPRALPQLHERWGEAKELFASRGERGATFIPNEKRSPELLLEEAHTCADRRLRDMQTIGGFDEASGRDDLYERPGEFDVHVPSNINIVDKRQLYSFVCSVAR